ncbi:MAG: OmpH family outer membrane protein [Bacteroidales bacterium]
MRNILVILALVLLAVVPAKAQKMAYIDTEYILANIPTFKAAQDQLDQISRQYQKELEAMSNELEKMYNDYRAESVLLSADMKKKREDVIVTKEKELKQKQKEYFGENGLLFKKRQDLVDPIQKEVYRAIEEVSKKGSYGMVFDKASGVSLLYSDSRYDISDDVLREMGYK